MPHPRASAARHFASLLPVDRLRVRRIDATARACDVEIYGNTNYINASHSLAKGMDTMGRGWSTPARTAETGREGENRRSARPLLHRPRDFPSDFF